MTLTSARKPVKGRTWRGSLAATAVAGLLLALASTYAYSQPDTAGAVKVASIEGMTESGKLAAGQRIVFLIETENTFSVPIVSLMNGFEIFSEDGAKWYPELLCDTAAGCDLQNCYQCIYGRWLGSSYWRDTVFSQPIPIILQVSTTARADNSGQLENIYGVGADSVFFSQPPLVGRQYHPAIRLNPSV